MTADQYLSRVKKIDAMIRNKLRERAHWKEVAEGYGGASVGERVQSSHNPQRGADAICNYVDIEREIETLKRERREIILTIERLPSTEYDLIYKLYVLGYSMKEIAYTFGKSYDWVKVKKRHALQLVQGMIDDEGKE